MCDRLSSLLYIVVLVTTMSDWCCGSVGCCCRHQLYTLFHSAPHTIHITHNIIRYINICTQMVFTLTYIFICTYLLLFYTFRTYAHIPKISYKNILLYIIYVFVYIMCNCRQNFIFNIYETCRPNQIKMVNIKETIGMNITCI